MPSEMALMLASLPAFGNVNVAPFCLTRSFVLGGLARLDVSMSNDKPALEARGRAVVFDVLRILAAIQVVIGHYAFSSHAVSRTTMYSSLLREEARYGYITVDIFFIISGYFITMTARKHSWQSFLLSRVPRIFAPLMVCGTLLTITTLRNRSECNGNTKTDNRATIDSIRDGRQRQVDPPRNPT